MRNLPFLIILLTLLAGCGQKGPLYLPEEPAAEPEATTASQPASE